MPSGWMPHGADDYAEGLANLLPRGPAWPREPDSILMQFVAGLAAVWGEEVDPRAAALLTRESDPRFTSELLDEWERAWGLPDPCVTAPQTVEERRLALVSKITELGGQSRAFFIALAAAMGYTITITEYSPFIAGYSHAGDPYWQVGSPGIRFYWKVTVPNPRVSWFIAGQAHAGIDPMARIARAQDLECRLNQLKPGHTQIIFSYSGI